MLRTLTVFTFLLIFAVSAFGQKNETMKIKLYFLNEKLDPNIEDCHAVKPTERIIPKTSAVATAAVKEFLKGVNDVEKAQGFVSLDPKETDGILKSINIKNGAAYVNFNKSVYEKTGTATTSCGGGFFSSIDAILLQFPTVKKVFYAIEGKPADFYDWVQVGECPKELKNCDGRNFN